MLKNIRGKSANLANARYRKMCIFASLINPIPIRLSKKLKEKHIFIIKLLVLIFHDGNSSHFTQIGEGLLKSAKVCSNRRKFAQTGLYCDNCSVWYLLRTNVESG